MAIARSEPVAAALAKTIDDDGSPHISVASVLECSIVLRGFKDLAATRSEEWLDQFLTGGRFTIDAVSTGQLDIARSAHLRFGKGMGHPAQLNFGDCFSYALAKALDAPLLYKGGDFAKTDIKSAL